jgi:large subunit ribosomal protein L18
MAEKKMDRDRKKMRVRKKVQGSKARPRLAVFRSAKHIYAQVIDDDAGRTLAAASSLSKDLGAGGEERSKKDVAFEVGKLVARVCQARGIKKVVFDRGGYRYHGRVARVAEGAREGGLEF